MAGGGRIVIVGAGVIGLKIADLLTLDGVTDHHPVEVRYDGHLLRSTSLVAAGLVFPAISDDLRLQGPWLRASMSAWKEETRTRPAWGVRPIRVRVVARDPVLPDPSWAEHAPNYRRLGPAERPAAYQGGSGFAFDSFLAPPGLYLTSLARRLRRRGVALQRCPVTALADVTDAAVVVNAAGVHGALLAGDDPSVTAVRGDVVVLPPIDGVEGAIVDDHDLAYVIAQPGRTLVGGTSIDLGADPAGWSTTVRPDLVAGILERAARLEPRVAHVEPVSVATGLRPCRPSVRVEIVRPAGGPPIVHAYGTGGSGWTIAPAVARWVVDAVKDVVGMSPYGWR
jgi:D-amino-acid oxidase